MSTPRRTVYRVETARTVCRCWSPADAKQLRAALDESNEYLRPWIPWMRDEPKTLQESAQWLRNNRANFDQDKDFRYAVFTPDETTLIGETGLYTRAGHGAREIGYWITKSCDGKGYATEVTQAMLKVAFEIDGIKHVEIHCAADNLPSLSIPKKLGFTLEKTLPEHMEDSAGNLHDSMIWVMHVADYPGSPASHFRIAAFDCTGDPIT
ncbi:MAG: GNAT family N-acetyltransferase [Gammaproteobacteria bacterium]